MNSLEVDWMLFTQEYTCAIEGCENDATEVDHCHSSGEVRSMLCSRCNLSLGNVGEDIGKLLGMIKYLSTHV